VYRSVQLAAGPVSVTLPWESVVPLATTENEVPPSGETRSVTVRAAIATPPESLTCALTCNAVPLDAVEAALFTVARVGQTVMTLLDRAGCVASPPQRKAKLVVPVTGALW
jgi:hypothetical protein